MARIGFIHDAMEIKFLLLYILDQVLEPVDFVTLTGLALCDEGVDYFSFAQCLAELVKSGNVKQASEKYSITDIGRQNNEICKDGLPASVRKKCDRNVAHVNAVFHRNAQVKSEILARPNGAFTLLLSLNDDRENIMTLRLFCASQGQAERLAEQYRADPELLYNTVLEILSPPGSARRE